MLKRRRELFQKTFIEEVLSTHAITKEAYLAIQEGKDELFLELREKELIRLEREFMQEKGVIPNNSLAPQEPINDAD